MVSVTASQPNGLIVCQPSVLAARVSSKSSVSDPGSTRTRRAAVPLARAAITSRSIATGSRVDVPTRMWVRSPRRSIIRHSRANSLRWSRPIRPRAFLQAYRPDNRAGIGVHHRVGQLQPARHDHGVGVLDEDPVLVGQAGQQLSMRVVQRPGLACRVAPASRSPRRPASRATRRFVGAVVRDHDDHVRRPGLGAQPGDGLGDAFRLVPCRDDGDHPCGAPARHTGGAAEQGRRRRWPASRARHRPCQASPLRAVTRWLNQAWGAHL